MSYTKLTDFAIKDSLPSGTGAKIVRGTELDAEFEAIEADSALKAPLASPTFTGTVTVPTPVNATDAATKGVVDALQTQIDDKAPLASPALTGVPTAPTATLGTNTTQLATTAFVQTQAFSEALPAQTGNAGKYVTTDGNTASWGNVPVAGMTLVATLTPTAAANLDFLTTFSSTYDNYLVIGDGITVAADDSVRLRLANAGTADSGSNYYFTNSATSAAFTTANTSHAASDTITSAGVGAGFEIRILNVNDASKVKVIHTISTSQSAATPAFANRYADGVYNAANTVSGFRLYLNGGANFGATGKIYVYGYSKS